MDETHDWAWPCRLDIFLVSHTHNRFRAIDIYCYAVLNQITIERDYKSFIHGSTVVQYFQWCPKCIKLRARIPWLHFCTPLLLLCLKSILPNNLGWFILQPWLTIVIASCWWGIIRRCLRSKESSVIIACQLCFKWVEQIETISIITTSPSSQTSIITNSSTAISWKEWFIVSSYTSRWPPCAVRDFTERLEKSHSTKTIACMIKW
jgi:hypothetical protein